MGQHIFHAQHGERRRLAISLAAIGGLVDAAGYLTLNGLFTAHMSGNSDRLGVFLGQGTLGKVAPVAFAVGTFLVSIAVATWFVEVMVRRRWRSPAGVILIVEALLLAAFAAIGPVLTHRGVVTEHRAADFYSLAALAVCAMGLQASSIRRASGSVVHTTYVSGILNDLAVQLAAVTHRDPPEGTPTYLTEEIHAGRPKVGARLSLLGGILVAYIGGAVVGSVAHSAWGASAVWLAVSGLAVLIAVLMVRPIIRAEPA